MLPLTTGEPCWELEFTENGELTGADQTGFVPGAAAQGLTDLFVFSHGWGTSEGHGRSLYHAMFRLIEPVAAHWPGQRVLGFAGLLWPSLWFPPTPATPPPQQGSAQAGAGAVVAARSGDQAVTGAQIAASLLPGFADPAQQATLTELGQLIDTGQAAAATEPDDALRQRLAVIQQRIQSLVPPPPDTGFEDAGERRLLCTTDPATDYARAAQVFGTVPAGGSEQDVGDWFQQAINGVKGGLRVLSYSVMKSRAGTIGRNGLGPLLARLHASAPGLRVHLIGHSFGARLVSFALSGVGPAAASPVASLTLVQGAFSHWSFATAQDNPFGQAGALNGFADRVHGPIVATHTPFDWAVGVWYPRASFLAQDSTSAAGSPGKWGGMGADGFQAVSPAENRVMPAGAPPGYHLAPGTFYRVDCSAVIRKTDGEPFSGAHSDIQHPEVAQLAVAAATAAG